MSEPMWLSGDDFAQGFDEECDECGDFTYTCACGADDPDKLHDDMDEIEQKGDR